MFCKFCGEKIGDTAMFCPKCGKQLKTVEVSAPQEPVAIEESANTEEMKQDGGNKITTAIVICLILILIAASIFLGAMLMGNTGNSDRREEDSQETEIEEDVAEESDDENSVEESSAEVSDVTETEAVEEVLPEEDLAGQSTIAVSEEIAEPRIEEALPEESPFSQEAYVEENIQEESEYILPNSNVEFLTKADLFGLTQEECRLARNELFARHGRRFQDAELQAYFDSCSWYFGTIEPEDFDDSMLNEYEVFNRDLIVEYEEEQGYR
ncbi:MAG: YARHG domain-containing protein [Lachnospiraceae bacterium]|nr:YARHG domain-containing protein [Lachnospiraceae bacterium]